MNKIAIIVKPIITEKSMQEVARGRFTFQVAKEADKPAIKREIENQFKVAVVSVSTLIVKGRRTRAGTRRIEKRVPAWKKAIVELAKGQKIALFDIATE